MRRHFSQSIHEARRARKLAIYDPDRAVETISSQLYDFETLEIMDHSTLHDEVSTEPSPHFRLDELTYQRFIDAKPGRVVQSENITFVGADYHNTPPANVYKLCTRLQPDLIFFMARPWFVDEVSSEGYAESATFTAQEAMPSHLA